MIYRTMSARLRKLIPIVLLTVVFSSLHSPSHSEPITGARPNPRPRPNPRKFIHKSYRLSKVLKLYEKFMLIQNTIN